MILGTGIDLVDMRRLKLTFEKYGDRFRDRLYTANEIAFCEKKPDPVAAFARHYAVKEAGCKALGTGMRMGVAWRGIELFRQTNHKPELRMHDGALARLESLVPLDHEPFLHVSISDEPPYATAIVTIEARPKVSVAVLGS